jgi:hypothetical protein
MTSPTPLCGEVPAFGTFRDVLSSAPDGLGRLAVVAEEIAQSVEWRCFAEEAARQLKIGRQMFCDVRSSFLLLLYTHFSNIKVDAKWMLKNLQLCKVQARGKRLPFF